MVASWNRRCSWGVGQLRCVLWVGGWVGGCGVDVVWVWCGVDVVWVWCGCGGVGGMRPLE
jgi:hypothetical protein